MRVKDAARIFNSNHITKLAKGDFTLIHKVSKELLKVDIDDDISLCAVFDRVYSLISKHYRYEYFFKNTIANKLLLGKHSLNTATLLSEFRVGKNIADCVLINGVSTCYEIKTEYDSLARLDEQLNAYCQLFDRVYVIIDERFINDILSKTPKHVGIIKLTKKNTLSTIREAEDLTSRDISIDFIMNSLRSNEYIELTNRLSGFTPDVGNIHMHSACKKLIEQAPLDLVRDQYRNILKYSRKNNSFLLNSLPKSLVNVGISYSLPIGLQRNLLSILNTVSKKELTCITQYSGENSLSY